MDSTSSNSKKKRSQTHGPESKQKIPRGKHDAADQKQTDTASKADDTEANTDTTGGVDDAKDNARNVFSDKQKVSFADDNDNLTKSGKKYADDQKQTNTSPEVEKNSEDDAINEEQDDVLPPFPPESMPSTAHSNKKPPSALVMTRPASLNDIAKLNEPKNGVRIVQTDRIKRVVSFNNLQAWPTKNRGDSAASSVSVTEPDDGAEGDNINVVVRVRPLNKQEQDKKDGTSVQFPGEGALWMESNGSTRPFTFNVVFEPEASQQDVFDHSGITKLIDMAINGYSCTTFAFGQTGSGKTHTITGPPQLFQEEPLKDHELYGLIPRSFRYLMKQIDERHLVQSASTTIRASYLEIYNEQVIDLLNPSQHGNLQVRWSKTKGFYVENLFFIECETLDDLFAVLEEGLKNRQTGSHNLNEFSSRSHSMLSLMIESEMQDPDDENVYITKHGKLSFVDLAGSEKVKDSQSSGEQLIETNNINRSLLVLGNCISALGDPKKRNGHIPYRDSKLTKLLADSLGGNGVTLMIACVSPSAINSQETMNTLRYANRAKKIKNKPVVIMDPREKLILSLKRELKLLRTENHYLREQLNFPSKPQGKHSVVGETEELVQVSKQIAEETSKDPFLALETKDTNSNLVHRQDTVASIKSAADNGLYEMLQEYMIENETLRSENTDLTKFKDEFKREHQNLARENDKLLKKLDDLERAVSVGFQPYGLMNGYRRRSDYDYYPSPDLTLSLSSTPVLHSSYNSFLSEQSYSGSPGSQRSARQSNDLPPVDHMRSAAYQHNAQAQRSGFYQGQNISPPGQPIRVNNRQPQSKLSLGQTQSYQNGGYYQPVNGSPMRQPAPQGGTWQPNGPNRDELAWQQARDRGPPHQQQMNNTFPPRGPPLRTSQEMFVADDSNLSPSNARLYKNGARKSQEQINVNNPIGNSLRDSQVAQSSGREAPQPQKKMTPRSFESSPPKAGYAKLQAKKSPAAGAEPKPTPRNNSKENSSNTPYEEIQDMNEKLRRELDDLESEIKQQQKLIETRPAGNYGKR